MKILVITQKIDENDDVLGFFTNWVKALSKDAEKVEVICLAKGIHTLPPNVSVYSLGKENNASKIYKAIRFYYLAFKLLRKVDGVFIHMAPEYVRALHPLNIFLRRPIVMWYAHIKVSPVARWAIDRVNFVLTPSKESFELDSPKVISTGHGIDTQVFKPSAATELGDVLSLSRISKVKRIETLIEAAELLKEKVLNPKINIYGQPARPEDHAYMEDLKEKVIEKKVEDLVVWPGSVSNRKSPEVYGGHKVFVRMQGGGGFGKTELEAMACGIPAIVPTEVYKKDLAEFSDDLYFKEDDALGLANCIQNVLEWTPEKLEKYREKARKLVVEKHNIENVAQKIISLLK